MKDVNAKIDGLVDSQIRLTEAQSRTDENVSRTDENLRNLMEYCGPSPNLDESGAEGDHLIKWIADRYLLKHAAQPDSCAELANIFGFHPVSVGEHQPFAHVDHCFVRLR